MAEAELPKSETIVAAHHTLLMAVRAALPIAFDDVSRDFGISKYEEMLTDYEVGSAFDTLKAAVLDDGWRIEPAVEQPIGLAKSDPARVALAERSQAIADFVTKTLDGMETELIDVCADLLDAVVFGSKIAEVIYKDGERDMAGTYVLKAIKAKPNKNVAFVVDEFANVIGIIGATKDKPVPVSGTLVTATHITIGREKAVVFTNAPKDSDPRGSSVLRKAYNAWLFKTKVIPEWFKYLQRFGSPTAIGEVGENSPSAVPKIDDATGEFQVDGSGQNIMVSAEWALREELLKWANGLVMSLPAGYKVNLLEAGGDGKAFTEAITYCDRAISRAILGTAQMTQEAQHESRSSKKVGQDVASLRVSRLRERLGNTLTRDVVRPLVMLNFGDEGLLLMPRLVFKKTDDNDKAANLKAYAQAYASGLIHDSQLPQIDADLGLAERDMEAMRLEREERNLQSRLLGGHIGTIDNPEDGSDDE